MQLGLWNLYEIKSLFYSKSVKIYFFNRSTGVWSSLYKKSEAEAYFGEDLLQQDTGNVRATPPKDYGISTVIGSFCNQGNRSYEHDLRTFRSYLVYIYFTDSFQQKNFFSCFLMVARF